MGAGQRPWIHSNKAVAGKAFRGTQRGEAVQEELAMRRGPKGHLNSGRDKGRCTVLALGNEVHRLLKEHICARSIWDLMLVWCGGLAAVGDGLALGWRWFGVDLELAPKFGSAAVVIRGTHRCSTP